ncbi:MAG: type II toxin-antitoxin system VapC family toxin [Candidatus Bathyarchaeia archaeon]
MIVVDGSALIAFFLREEGWSELAEYMVRTISLDQAVKEFYNAIWRAVNISKRITKEEALRSLSLFKTYLSGNMDLRKEEEHLDKALEIALENGITIYDALYISLAIHENKPLLTLDRKQREVSRKYNVMTLP